MHLLNLGEAVALDCTGTILHTGKIGQTLSCLSEALTYHDRGHKRHSVAFAQTVWKLCQKHMVVELCKIQDLGGPQSTNTFFLTIRKHTIIPMLGIEPLSDRNFPASLITIVQWGSMIAIEVAMSYMFLTNPTIQRKNVTTWKWSATICYPAWLGGKVTPMGWNNP